MYIGLVVFVLVFMQIAIWAIVRSKNVMKYRPYGKTPNIQQTKLIVYHINN